jgi:ribose/xylose/arabinose/galactoside ABC-type transport system permease subunit
MVRGVKASGQKLVISHSGIDLAEGTITAMRSVMMTGLAVNNGAALPGHPHWPGGDRWLWSLCEL